MTSLIKKLSIYLHKKLAYPHPTHEVHCGQCGWWGTLSQLKPVYVPDYLHTGVAVELGCPMCLSDQQLEYKEADKC